MFTFPMIEAEISFSKVIRKRNDYRFGFIFGKI